MTPAHTEYRVTRQEQASRDFVYVSGKRPDGRWELLATYELRHADAPPDGCGGYLPDGRYLHPFDMGDESAAVGYQGSLDDWVREHGGAVSIVTGFVEEIRVQPGRPDLLTIDFGEAGPRDQMFSIAADAEVLCGDSYGEVKKVTRDEFFEFLLSASRVKAEAHPLAEF